MTGLSVLSFGFTRGLWDGESSEDVRRMGAYSQHLEAYIAVTNSYRRHRLSPIRLAPGFDAIPTNAFCPVDSFFHMLRIGRSILRTRKIDIIQAQDPFFSGLVAVLLGKWFRLPVNVCVYGPNVYDEHWLASHWSHGLLGRVGRWVLSQARCIQVDGKMTARSLVEAGRPSAQIEVKPMVPANLERFLAIDRSATPQREVPRLLYVGRLAAQKNLPLLLAAVKALKQQGANPCTLLIVGDGPEENSLRAMVEREGLQSCVEFRGVVSREAIHGVFAEADLLVLTSDYEGYPRVLMEAAAAALPIVTTAVSGSDEALIDGETGHIVPIGDVQAVIRRIAALLASPGIRARMGEAARRHIRAQLNPAVNTPGQVAIWKKITAGRSTPDQTSGSLRPGCELPRRLLLFNLVTDVKHPILGFTTQWIRELAGRVESIDVITMRAGEIDVPSNVRVHSVGAELGYSEARRVIEFYRHLFRILRTERIDGCFSHMIQIFSVLAGPVLRARGIPLITWYAHPKLNPVLKLAHLFSNRMVTSLPAAYPWRKDKLVVIGQGIDAARFAPANSAVAEDDLILCAGRISRVKNHPTLLRAIALLPQRVRVVILGATSGADDEVYAGELRQLAVDLGIADVVTFFPPVPPAELPEHYRRCAVHVNLTPAGFGDKVAWEAMSCGRPCLVANADFRETLGDHQDELLFRGEEPLDLAAKLTALLAKSAVERDAIGRYLRSQVERLHSLPRLADRILVELGSLLPRQNDAPAVMPIFSASEEAS